MALELNVLALMKGSHRYVYVFDDGACPKLVEHLQRQAEDSELSLNWFDAAVLEERAARQVDQQGDADPPFQSTEV